MNKAIFSWHKENRKIWKKYYAERHGLLTKQLQIDFDELLQYFGQVYKYFCDKRYFGGKLQEECGGKFLIRRIRSRFYHQSLLPSPEVYFATCLQDKEVWPIWQYLEEYDEQTLFSVIEILYDHIGVYNYEMISLKMKHKRKNLLNKLIISYVHIKRDIILVDKWIYNANT